MANEKMPSKPKISLAPVKALTKPVVDGNDVPRRALQIAVPAKPVAATKATVAKSSIGKPQASKSAPENSTPVAAKPATSKAAIAVKSAQTAKTAPVYKAVKPKSANPESAVVAPAKPMAGVAQIKPDQAAATTSAFQAAMPIAPDAIFDTIRNVQQRTSVLAQTLVAASQDDFRKLLTPSDPAALMALQVAAMTRTQTALKSYWMDVFSVIQHKG